MAPIRAWTVHTVLCRVPGRDGCGSRVHTIPESLATSTAATFSYTRSCSSSSITCGLPTGGLLSCEMRKWQRAARGPRSAGTKPGILTVVLKGNNRRPSGQGPSARLSNGFATQGPPASAGSPRPTLPRPPPHQQADSNHHTAATPARHHPHHRRHFTPRDHPPDETALNATTLTHCHPGQAHTVYQKSPIRRIFRVR